MTARLIRLPRLEPGSPEWHEQRVDAVGGSEISAVLGISRFDSRFSLWHRKKGLIAPDADNPQMEWGRILEPAIAAKYATAHPELKVRRTGTFHPTGRTWQIASPDRDQMWPDRKHRPLEIKTAYNADDWGEPGTDEIPVYYRAQCLWYLDVLGQDWCDLAVLIGGSDYREYRVHYDADEARMMVDAAAEFIGTLRRDERPDIDAHSATYQAVREMHPDIDPVDVEISVELARDYCTARTEMKRAQADMQMQTSRLADAIGTARRAVCFDTVIATRQARGNGAPYLVAGRNLPDFLKAA